MSSFGQIEGTPLDAQIEDTPDGGLRVRVGDEVRTFHVLASVPGRHLVQEGQARVTLRVARSGDVTWVRAGAAIAQVRPVDAPVRGRRRAAVGGAVTPPMPGVVERVLVAVGDAVEAGATLVVVSAMKMEHALVAPHAGVVREVRVGVGDKVRPGEMLVEIEAPETAKEGTDA